MARITHPTILFISTQPLLLSTHLSPASRKAVRVRFKVFFARNQLDANAHEPPVQIAPPRSGDHWPPQLVLDRTCDNRLLGVRRRVDEAPLRVAKVATVFQTFRRLLHALGD
jgi:hypothetical protein